jgi:hypothetical protein
MVRPSVANVLWTIDAVTVAQHTPAETLQQRDPAEATPVPARSQHLGLPYWRELPEHEFDAALMARVSRTFARRHGLVPSHMEHSTAWVATNRALSAVPTAFGKRVVWRVQEKSAALFALKVLERWGSAAKVLHVTPDSAQVEK